MSGKRAGTSGGVTKQVQLSKTLSWILRHGAQKAGITLRDDGFAVVDDLLSLPQLRGVTVEEVEAVVAGNDKQRFALQRSPSNRLLIRANQGHSIALKELDLKHVTDPAEYPIVVHGTRASLWPRIKEQGLSRMGRQHVHFAKDVPGAGGVISGMRSDTDLRIYLDLPRALSAGLTVWESANGVLLCPGNENGFIASSLFDRVERREGDGWEMVEL